MLAPECEMPGCEMEAVSGGRFCAECDNLLDGTKPQAQAQQQPVAAEVASTPLSERQTEAVALLARRPDLSQAVKELLERASFTLEVEDDESPLLVMHSGGWDDEPPLLVMHSGGWDLETVVDEDMVEAILVEAILKVADVVGFTQLVEAHDREHQTEPEPDDAPQTEGNDG